MDEKVLLDVRDLSVSFRMYGKGLEQKDLTTISGLNVSVREGEILAVAGSSGSGKSLLAHAVLGILPHNAQTAGSLSYDGQELTPDLQKKLRGRQIALVPQSVAYLDPLMRVARQVAGADGEWDKQRAVFQRYNLKQYVERLFPFQLSGGMARRILLAPAVIGDARLIIADEPTPGLSQDIARRAMGHFRELADEGRGVMLITHDLELALSYADRIAVFYAGTTVEIASVEEFRQGEDALRHPYTKALWRALPGNGFRPTPGTQPYAGSLPDGCLFMPRCDHKTKACEQRPPMRELRGGKVCCIHAT